MIHNLYENTVAKKITEPLAINAIKQYIETKSNEFICELFGKIKIDQCNLATIEQDKSGFDIYVKLSLQLNDTSMRETELFVDVKHITQKTFEKYWKKNIKNYSIGQHCYLKQPKNIDNYYYMFTQYDENGDLTGKFYLCKQAEVNNWLATTAEKRIPKNIDGKEILKIFKVVPLSKIETIFSKALI